MITIAPESSNFSSVITHLLLLVPQKYTKLTENYLDVYIIGYRNTVAVRRLCAGKKLKL